MRILSRDFLTRIIEIGRAYRSANLCKNELKAKQTIYPYNKTSKPYRQTISDFFGGGKSVQWSEFYNHFRPMNDDKYNCHYIPDNIYYGIIDIFYNDYTKCLAVDDKNLYDFYFKDIRIPKTILRKSNDVLMDEGYNIINIKQITDIISQVEHGVIIKKSTISEGGKNIHIWTPKDTIDNLIEILNNYTDCVVQNLIEQHESLSYLHKDSVNTIRIITWNRKNQIIPLSSIVRMGVNGSKVDNASSGGIFCGINEDGSLKDTAYNTRGESFVRHPQGAEFKGHRIPNFDKCLKLVTSLAPRFSAFSRLTSWDITLDKDGEPTIIEANLAYGELDFHQIANGPLFGAYTEEMLNEVFSSKKNRILRTILNRL